MAKKSLSIKLSLWGIIILFFAAGGALNGQIWEASKRLTNASGNSYTYNRSVAVCGDSVHVIWTDSRSSSESRLFYKHSTDAGANWNSDMDITGFGDVDFASLAISGSTLHTAWSGNHPGNREISYKRSTDNGATWTQYDTLTENDSTSRTPNIAVSGNNVHVVWSDNRDDKYELYYKRSTNNGVNWDVDRKDTNSTGESFTPAIAVTGDTIHVVWSDTRDGNNEIYYKRSTNNGDDWGNAVRLTNNDSASIDPAIAVSGRNVHVVWEDKRNGEAELFYIRSVNAGTTWAADTALTNDAVAAGRHLKPSIAVSDTSVHVVWGDDFSGTSHIYYKRSRHNGTGWEDNIKLTDNASTKYSPSIACRDYALHIVWTDERDGNPEVYYKSGLSGELQPDNLIKNHYEHVYIGDGIYNNDGLNQVEEQSTKPGDPAIYHIRITNDGDIPEKLLVGGTASDTMWKIAYYDSLSGGTDITSLIAYNMWSTPTLASGEFVEIRAEVTPNASIPKDSTFAVLVTTRSENDTTKLDVVKALTVTSENPGVKEATPDLSYSLSATPVDGSVLIAYSVPQTVQARLVICDVSGRVIKNLLDELLVSGAHHISWNGLDDAGMKLPKGVYFCKLNTETESLSDKFLLLN